VTSQTDDDDDCSICDQSLSSTSAFLRGRTARPLVVAVHAGAPCGFLVHAECAEEVEQWGRVGEGCPCGRGSVTGGIGTAQAGVRPDPAPDGSESDDTDSESAGLSDVGVETASEPRVCAACGQSVSSAGAPGSRRVWQVVDSANEPCGCWVHDDCYRLLGQSGPLVGPCLCRRNRLSAFALATSERDEPIDDRSDSDNELDSDERDEYAEYDDSEGDAGADDADDGDADDGDEGDDAAEY
jgi:hypothetical protein